MSKLTELPDHELFARWCEGDDAAGAVLLTRYFDRLYAFFRPRASEHTEDLIQTTMLRLVQSRERFAGRSSFATFVMGTARNVLFEHYHALHKRRLHFDPGSHSLVDLGQGASTVLDRAEQDEIVAAAMRLIPVDDAVLLTLYLVQGLSAPELAKEYGLGEPALRGRIRRAKERLAAAVLKVASSPAQGARASRDLEQWWADRLAAERGADATKKDGGEPPDDESDDEG